MRKDAHKRYALYASFYYKISKAKLVFEGGLRREDLILACKVLGDFL